MMSYDGYICQNGSIKQYLSISVLLICIISSDFSNNLVIQNDISVYRHLDAFKLNHLKNVSINVISKLMAEQLNKQLTREKRDKRDKRTSEQEKKLQ